jgi:hypothetical protein
MAHRALTEDGRISIACFKCREGCVHLEYANLVITFTQAQFLAFSEVIMETRQRLLQEQDHSESLDAERGADLLM